MARVSDAERADAPAEDFAVPGKRKLWIKDAEHTRLAWDMVERTEGLTAAEKLDARRRILARAHRLGVDTKDWTKPRA